MKANQAYGHVSSMNVREGMVDEGGENDEGGVKDELNVPEYELIT